MYKAVLVFSVPEEAAIDRFPDDLAVVVTTKYPEDVTIYAMEMVKAVKSWLEGSWLALADEKSEVVLTNRKKKSTVKMSVDIWLPRSRLLSTWE